MAEQSGPDLKYPRTPHFPFSPGIDNLYDICPIQYCGMNYMCLPVNSCNNNNVDLQVTFWVFPAVHGI